MTENELTPQDLEPELRRVGITWQVFARLAQENQAGQPSPEPVSISLGLERTAELLKSLPDGAGEAKFLEAWKARFATPAMARMKHAEELARKRAHDEQAGA